MSDEEVGTALERFEPNIKLLSGAVSGLESVLRRAEKLDDERVIAAQPYLGLIWLYSSAILDLLHTKRQDGRFLWNAPALAALCRPLQEALLSFIYFCIEQPPPEEFEFRQLLLARHSSHKRWDLLSRADQSKENIAREYASALTEVEAKNRAISEHPFLTKLDHKVASAILNKGDKYMVDSLDMVWERACLPRGIYDVTFRYLSQFAHATPYAALSLNNHKADHEDGAVNMSIPVTLALVCVVKTIDCAGDLHPDLEALLPPAFSDFMGS